MRVFSLFPVILSSCSRACYHECVGIHGCICLCDCISTLIRDVFGIVVVSHGVPALRKELFHNRGNSFYFVIQKSNSLAKMSNYFP